MRISKNNSTVFVQLQFTVMSEGKCGGLNGTVALITGGGQGLGFAFSEVLVENGVCVSILILY